MTQIRLVTWNINSVRLRAEAVARFIAAEQPDILCLQETKCRDGEFPEKTFESAGLPHLAIHGQAGGRHGVAIASRFPIEQIEAPDLCREGHARVVSAMVEGIELHNIYLPAGGDVPDVEKNPKFDHKLDFVARLGDRYAQR
ncbi:MAG: endonuclease/exonuclease/phosphatase family protein, partial [Pseudomonadota bacterium]